MITLTDLEDAAETIYRAMPPTPQYAWPLLADALGASVHVKHENHTPIGAFKVRGGLVYLDGLKRRQPDVPGIVCATRGNHGQSLAFAARRVGVPCTILVPHGNSTEKNDAMRAFGAQVIEHGSDFDEARVQAGIVAQQCGYEFVPSFHRDLVRGVGTYGLEFLRTFPELDTVYVPIGLGSGICGMIAARDALNLKTRIVGVVSEGADAYALSLNAGHVIETNAAQTFADGMAVRVPNAEALATIAKGADRIVRVSDETIADAVRLYYRATHNLAEGAGAAALAALMSEREKMTGRSVGVVLSGHNIDRGWMATILGGGTPQ